MNRKKYRKCVCCLLLISILALGVGSWAALREQIPEQIQVSQKDEIPSFFHELVNRFLVEESIQEESGEVSYRLFGKIPLRTVSVSVVPRKSVYAGGNPIGIYLETDGVLVVETGVIISENGKKCCPAENIVRSGDYIQSVNGENVGTKEELIACISRCDGNDIVLDVLRSGEPLCLRLHPVQDETGTYKAGIWVRNDTQGIGTLTYIDQEGSFGALGHGISDIDTGELLQIDHGVLYDAEVVSVIKGIQGTPGELSGVIHYSDGYQIGTICQNEENGIYGSVTAFPSLIKDSKLYEVAHKQEVQEGPAVILSTVNGSRKEYQVEIKEIRLNGKDINKGMILEVTDQELLELTGGIVQGMGVIDNRDNTKKPGNTGFFSSYPKIDPTIGV